jgi:hypothetical protein
MSTQDKANTGMDWIIAEYQELRKEINRRSKEQFICIAGSIASLGSVLAFIAKDAAKYSALLIIVPWILCVFGFIWTDHARHIFLQGSYIRNKIEKQVNLIAGYSDTMGWQSYVFEIRNHLAEKKNKPSLVTYLLPLIYFLFPSIICLITYIIMSFTVFKRLPIAVEVALLSVGIILLIAITLNWRRAVKTVDRNF